MYENTIVPKSTPSFAPSRRNVLLSPKSVKNNITNVNAIATLNIP